MYMANCNASPNAREPNATHIPLARIGGRIGCAGLRVGRMRVFGYQLVLGV